MGETTPAVRERVYAKARATVAAKLAAISPPPPPSVADRQRRALEDAIASIEKEYTANSDPLSELEDVLASLKNPQPKVLEQPSVKTGAWPKATPAPAAPRPAAPAARQPAPPPPSGAQAGSGRRSGCHVRRSWRRDAPEEFTRQRPDAVRKRSFGPLLVAAVMLAVIAGGGYGIWLNRDAFGDMPGFGGGSGEVATTPLVTEPAAETPAAEALAGDANETPKFTQRLTPEGNETDPGPANGGATVGEGTSVATLTQPPGATPPIAEQPGAGACARRRRGDPRRDGRGRRAVGRSRSGACRRPEGDLLRGAHQHVGGLLPSPARSSGRWCRNRLATICRPSRRSAPRPPSRARTCNCA